MELSRAEWAGHLERWRESGETATRYCEEHGLKLGSLRYWSGRIGRERAEAARELAPTSEVTFARVERRRPRRASAAASGVLRLRVDGVEVDVPSDFDGPTLRRLLEVLRSSGGGSR